MAELKPETQEWSRQVEAGSDPYARNYIGKALVVFSSVADSNHAVKREIKSGGFAWWKLVNTGKRKLKITCTCQFPNQRAIWAGGRSEDPETLDYTRTVDRTTPGDLFFSEEQWDQQFTCEKDGLEILSTKHAEHSSSLKSSFIAVSSKSEKVQKMKKSKDWLGALAKMVAGLPGGSVLIAPLLRIYDQDRAAVYNQRIEDALAENRAISEETLQKLLGIEEVTRDLHMALGAAAGIINGVNVSNGEPEAVDSILRSQLSVSDFPIPISPELLVEEMVELFPDRNSMGALEDCLGKVMYNEIPSDAKTAGEFIHRLVLTLKGKDSKKLAALFGCLSQKRSDSNILKFASQYLNGDKETTT